MELLPSQLQVGTAENLPNPPSTSAMTTSTTDTSAWVPVMDWKETISRILDSHKLHNIRIRIEICTGPMMHDP